MGFFLMSFHFFSTFSNPLVYFFAAQLACYPSPSPTVIPGLTRDLLHQHNFFKSLCCNFYYDIYLLFLFVLKQKGTEKIQGRSDAAPADGGTGSARFAGQRTKTSLYRLHSITLFL